MFGEDVIFSNVFFFQTDTHTRVHGIIRANETGISIMTGNRRGTEIEIEIERVNKIDNVTENENADGITITIMMETGVRVVDATEILHAKAKDDIALHMMIEIETVGKITRMKRNITINLGGIVKKIIERRNQDTDYFVFAHTYPIIYPIFIFII